MPLTLTLTEGVLPTDQEAVVMNRLAEAMLKWHGLAGNRTMAANVIGTLHVLPRDRIFAGMQPAEMAVVEWKVPAFAFTQRAVQIGYCEEVTQLLHAASGGRLPPERIFVNVVHAVDGAWNWGGKALTNAEIGEAVTAG